MSWNYRIIKTTSKNFRGEDVSCFAVHSVYYEPTGMSIKAEDLAGFDDLTHLRETLEACLEALSRPVMVYNSDGRLVDE